MGRPSERKLIRLSKLRSNCEIRKIERTDAVVLATTGEAARRIAYAVEAN